MDGILLIDKPQGWTSFDVVAKVRGMIRKETGVKKPKVGHAGTLDPLATGLLVVLVGSYCKRAEAYTKQDKVYEVELKLGQTSTTDDDEGEKTDVSSSKPTREAVDSALDGFIGEIQQVPPIFSAIKVDGKRAYKEARAGRDITLKPRTVTIHSIEGVEYEYPFVRFTANVSSGTYIRSLARDIGEKLGTGAYMSNLRRTEVGTFSIADAQPIDSLDLSRLRQV